MHREPFAKYLDGGRKRAAHLLPALFCLLARRGEPPVCQIPSFIPLDLTSGARALHLQFLFGIRAQGNARNLRRLDFAGR
jgi:hypothetical protein